MGIGQVQRMAPLWKQHNVKTIGLSVDSKEDHEKWIQDIVKSCNREFNTVESPMIADKDRKVARIYGMLDDTNVNKAGLPLTVRSVFLIDPQKKIRAILTYPATLGRNFNEILRMIQSLQLTDKHKV